MIVLRYRIEEWGRGRQFSYFVLHGGAVAAHDEQLSVVYSYSAIRAEPVGFENFFEWPGHYRHCRLWHRGVLLKHIAHFFGFVGSPLSNLFFMGNPYYVIA